MTHRSAYHTLIAAYYLKPISPEGVALKLNAELQSTVITARMVRDVFDQEYESGPNGLLYRQLGERPAAGFDPHDLKVQLTDTLVGHAA